MSLRIHTEAEDRGICAVVTCGLGIERHRTKAQSWSLLNAKQQAIEDAEAWIEEHNRTRQEQPQ